MRIRGGVRGCLPRAGKPASVDARELFELVRRGWGRCDEDESSDPRRALEVGGVMRPERKDWAE